MEWILIYLLVMTEQIRDAASSYGGWMVFTSVATLGSLFAGALYWAEGDAEEEDKKRYLKKGRNFLIFLWTIPFTLALVHTLLPTQKNMAIIVGTGITYSAVTSETGQRIGGKAVELLEKKINDALEDKEVGKEEKEQEETPKESGSKVPPKAT